MKGSGGDLAKIEASGFSPVRMDHLLALAKLPALSDPQMVNELRTHMTRASAPTPSVEAILHALLPFKFVDHTHADAIVTLTNSPGGADRIREVFGDTVVVIPYVMPGFDLARACAERYAAAPQTVGMVLMNHGIFSFGETARESYDRMIALVTRAEEHLAAQARLEPAAVAVRGARARSPGARWRRCAPPSRAPPGSPRCSRCTTTTGASPSRGAVTWRRSRSGGRRRPTTSSAPSGCRCSAATWRGTWRPTARYFEEHAPKAREPKTMLDPAPRVVLDAELGVGAVGRSAKEAAIVFDVYGHTMDIIERATLLGGWQALPAKELFDVEYWDLEQAKLRAAGAPLPLAGEVALVTGAASGIGKAVVDSLLARGAAVVGLDLNPAIEKLHARPDFVGVACDVTSAEQLSHALDATVRAFGGLDMLVLNAGIFPGGRRIEELGDEEWRRVLHVNLDANLALMRETQPLLALAPRGGRVVVVGSKNVPAPGPGAAAYSASKAALTQLARVAALEWGASGIRVNTLHPDAVFDTGIWTPEVLAARAKSYGMTVEQYKTKNVLRTEVRSVDVAELAAELCGSLFAKTTGAQIPVDGGNDRVI